MKKSTKKLSGARSQIAMKVLLRKENLDVTNTLAMAFPEASFFCSVQGCKYGLTGSEGGFRSGRKDNAKIPVKKHQVGENATVIEI